MSDADLLTRRDAVFGAGTPQFYKEPIEIVRGDGAFLYDQTGRQYTDMYNNVPCVGHCHPHVVEAMHRQARTLNVHSRYLHEGIVSYAERLLDKHHASLNRIVFTCTGTEANEVALLMARKATGGEGVICTGHAYHGNSELVGRLTRADNNADPMIRTVRFPDAYRPSSKAKTVDELVNAYLVDVQDAIDSFKKAGVALSCIIVCPIYANEGLTELAPLYLERAARMVRDAGGLVISDEVQSGFCRTGHWWGYEATNFVPDIATMGKPMGNGMPIGGVVAPAEIVEPFRKERRYFNTFAGSPLQAAAGAAVLDVIENEQVLDNVRSVGDYLKSELKALDWPYIGDVRGYGLFIGVDWVADADTKTPNPEGAASIVERLKTRGFLTNNAGAYRNVLKLRPPLVFKRVQAEQFLSAFKDAIAETV